VWIYSYINAHGGKNTCTHIHPNPRASLRWPQFLFSLSKSYPVASHILRLLFWYSKNHYYLSTQYLGVDPPCPIHKRTVGSHLMTQPWFWDPGTGDKWGHLCLGLRHQGKAGAGDEAEVGLMYSRPLYLFYVSRDRDSTNWKLLLETNSLKNQQLQGKEAVSEPCGDCCHPLSTGLIVNVCVTNMRVTKLYHMFVAGQSLSLSTV
jgi:hypothetical protein